MIKNTSEVVSILANGGLVCMATDTLFALSCDATNSAAIDRLYKFKRRDKEKKLPVFFYSLKHVMEYCDVSETAIKLAERFWPGKLTMILQLKSTSNISDDAFNEKDTSIAVRVPGYAHVLDIISELNRPIIGTSANISGCDNLYKIEEVEKQFADTEVKVFSSNATIGGVQSTIISIEDEKIHIIREGAIAKTDLEKVINF